MKTSIILSALALILPVSMSAEPALKLLGFSSPNSEIAKIKAEITLDGHTIEHVDAISYDLTDGSSTVLRDSYRLFDGKYISSDFNVGTTHHYYRLLVTLDDGTKLMTECANQANNEAFMWVTDFPWTTHTCRVDPAIDVCINGETLLLNSTPYYKGISSQGGMITYNFPAEYNFTKASTRIAVQSGTEGSLQFRLSINGGTDLGFTRSIGSYYDINSTDWTQYVPSLPITSLRFNFSQNQNTVANFLIPRLYMTRTSTKQAQTVNFNTHGAKIDYPQTVTIDASATSGGDVFYELLSGADAVEINGHDITFRDGFNTKVIILATQYGDDTYSMACSTLTFDVQTGGKIFYSSYLASNNEATPTGFLAINPAGKTLEQLKVYVYDNVNNLNKIGEIDLLEAWNALPGASSGRFLPFDASLTTANSIFRIAWQFVGEDLSFGPYRHIDGTSFDFMSDLPYTRNLGYGQLKVDLAYSGARLNLAGTGYAKGFGIHGNPNNWIQTNFDLSQYERFRVTVGKQNGQPYNMAFSIYAGPNQLAATGDIPASRPVSYDLAITPDMPYIRIHSLNGTDGTGNDHGSICAPRFIHKATARRTQTVDWPSDHELINDRPFSIDLRDDCTVSSGRPLFFRIVSGGEFANITDEYTLNITSIPEAADIVVEAYQPGNREWAPSNIATTTFHLGQGKVVNLDEEITLNGGTDLNDLVVYTDGSRSGHVQVKSGIVNVRHLRLRYTFVPGKWYSICFPSNVDIDRISNLAEKGYNFNDGYTIKAFSSREQSNYPDQSPWQTVTSTRVDRNRGYMICLDEAMGTAPVEIEFHIDNVNLDHTSQLHVMNLTLDLSQVYGGTEHVVYVKPANVKGNTLKVIVDYQPADPSQTPVNHAKALEEARITFAPKHAGIRIVLPDATPSKVAIFDAKMRLVKAVRYVAPNLIDLSDLPCGIYTLAIQYGPATRTIPLEWHK